MIEINRIRENKDEIIEKLKKRNFDAEPIVSEILSLDQEWRSAKQKKDDVCQEMNSIAKEIGQLFKAGNTEEGNAKKARATELKEVDKDLKDEVDNLADKIQQSLYELPNVPNEEVPAGGTEEDNVVVSTHGELPDMDAEALPHWEITKKYDLIDFELGVKVTGAGFPIYKNKGARLLRGLINFFLDEANKAGYTEFVPPLMVNEASGYGTGQLPDKEGQMYHVTEDDLYLIPTAEVPLTNMFRDVILNESDFPICVTGYTPCFRREAGSYGSDVRGLNRLHQFDKVEIVRVEHPDKSYEALDGMVKHVASLLEKLELPYRILRLCGGDLGFTSAITYDFEVYSAAQKKWLEVSSVSNFETFQANRLKLRYKDANKKKALVHTLNGSALALPRIMAALLENNQSENGVIMPAAIHNYIGFEKIA
ncbi:MAG: serine--tRNA ligase [Crocinitomicaceae bacterium]|nr:serine--tRNA ligase [Crocinitomicaceae bacterium]